MDSTKPHFTVIAKHPTCDARVGKLLTAHGETITPTFMPVGTKAAVSGVTAAQLVETRSQMILGGNTYHMLINPGLEMIEANHGMHQMMAWDRPMLTDSGGFQVFSLSRTKQYCKITEEGARFKHPVNGAALHMNSESSIWAQKVIGADVIMTFDYCTPDSEDKAFVEQCMGISHEWVRRSVVAHQKHPQSLYGKDQLFFGIVQGGYFQDLRIKSAEFMLEQPIDGIAIGGETVGYDMQKTEEILGWLSPVLPDNMPHYSMGVGMKPQDLIDVVAKGMDLFDCVAPTRNARHGALYCGEFVVSNGWLRFDSEFKNSMLNLKNSRFALDDGPIMPGCDCETCANHSRSYLRYLLKSGHISFFTLASIHNIRVMQKTCELMHEIILKESQKSPLPV